MTMFRRVLAILVAAFLCVGVAQAGVVSKSKGTGAAVSVSWFMAGYKSISVSASKNTTNGVTTVFVSISTFNQVTKKAGCAFGNVSESALVESPQGVTLTLDVAAAGLTNRCAETVVGTINLTLSPDGQTTQFTAGTTETHLPGLRIHESGTTRLESAAVDGLLLGENANSGFGTITNERTTQVTIVIND